MIFPGVNYGAIGIHPNIVDALCLKPDDIRISYDQAVRAIICSCMGCSLGYIDQELGVPFRGPLEHRFWLGNEAQEAHQKIWLYLKLAKNSKTIATVYDFNNNQEVVECRNLWDVELLLRKYKHPDKSDDCKTSGMSHYLYSAEYKSRLDKGKRNGI